MSEKSSLQRKEAASIHELEHEEERGGGGGVGAPGAHPGHDGRHRGVRRQDQEEGGRNRLLKPSL